MAHRWVSVFVMGVAAVVVAVSPVAASDDNEICFECHGSFDAVREAAAALEVEVADERAGKLVIARAPSGSIHEGLLCTECHAGADEVPHPESVGAGNPCITCHDGALAALNKSVHGDYDGGLSLNAPCWACHGGHDVRPTKDPASAMAPVHVAERCLQCHDKQDYLRGVHGKGVQLAGLDVAATCVSCHGGHDITSARESGSRVARRNISITCGACHGRVAEQYRHSVHGAALTDTDNPDVPTCADCHEAHNTEDPFLPRFRLGTVQTCGHCHADKEMMARYGISTDVFDTYVADFHGTTAELFRAASPDQPLNKAVCYDCHGYHDIASVRGEGHDLVADRLLVRCQACHPGAKPGFITAWTGHYVPSPSRYPVIYYVKLFYDVIIPATVGFFLFYIAIDVIARRRQRRRG